MTSIEQIPDNPDLSAEAVERRTRLGRGLALFGSVSTFVGGLMGTMFTLGPKMAEQLDTLKGLAHVHLTGNNMQLVAEHTSASPWITVFWSGGLALLGVIGVGVGLRDMSNVEPKREVDLFAPRQDYEVQAVEPPECLPAIARCLGTVHYAETFNPGVEIGRHRSSGDYPFIASKQD